IFAVFVVISVKSGEWTKGLLTMVIPLSIAYPSKSAISSAVGAESIKSEKLKLTCPIRDWQTSAPTKASDPVEKFIGVPRYLNETPCRGVRKRSFCLTLFFTHVLAEVAPLQGLQLNLA